MNRFLCLVGGALSCLTLVVGSSVCLPQWAAKVGVDLWNAEEAELWLQRESVRSIELDRHMSVALYRVESKEAITTQLVEGRITLLEAARAFLPVQQLAEQDGARIPDALINLPEEERACRSLIAWAEAQLREEPSRRTEIVTRLQSELEEHLLAGKLHLTE